MATFEIYEDKAGEFRWRIRSGGDIMADSGEGYVSRDGARQAVFRVKEYVPDADVLDMGNAAFEVYQDRRGGWRWRLRHRNGNILGDSGESYSSRTAVHDAIESIKENSPDAETEEL